MGGVGQIVRCLARDMSVARPAVVLLHELAQDGKGGNITSVRVKLESDRSAILCLVTLATGRDPEAGTSARFVLQPLSDRDENVIQMAKANWFPPLIARLREGHLLFLPSSICSTLLTYKCHAQCNQCLL